MPLGHVGRPQLEQVARMHDQRRAELEHQRGGPQQVAGDAAAGQARDVTSRAEAMLNGATRMMLALTR